MNTVMHNVTLLAVALGLATALAWGTADFFVAKAAKRYGGWPAALFIGLTSVVAYMVAYFVFLRPATLHFSTEGVIYGLLSGLSVALAGILFTKGTVYGPVSIVSPISSTYPLFTALVTIMAFGAILTTNQLGGIGLIVAGVIVASGAWHHIRGKTLLGIGPIYGLAAALSWGIGYGLLAHAIALLGWETATLLEEIGLGATCLILFAIIKSRSTSQPMPIKKLLTDPFVWGAGLLNIGGALTLNLGLASGIATGTLTVAVSASYPALTMLLALRSFKENVGKIPLIGAFVSVVGVVILSLG
jgi:transporter family protein